MSRRIFLANFFSAFLVAITCSILFSWVTFARFLELETNKAEAQLHLSSHGVQLMGASFFETLDFSHFRLTWIDEKGQVLFDSHSEAKSMENHADRDEVRSALLDGQGSDRRQSETLLTKLVYSAQRLEDGTVLRVANQQSTLVAFLLSMLEPLLIVFLLAGFFSWILAYSLAKAIIKPLSLLDLDHPLENMTAYEEIAPMLAQIQRQYQKNERHVLELSRKKEEFETITKNMREGLILLSPSGRILSLNHSSSQLFGCDSQNSIGKNILHLHRSVAMQSILSKAFLGEREEGMVELNAEIYQVTATPIMEKSEMLGLAVLLVNVTERSESEQIRREFTANVSHELKTPLHSISGCAELLSHNFVKNEDIPQFAEQIYSEAQRLIRLVDEIINLSQLDEGLENITKEELDFCSVAKDVVENLKDMGKEYGLVIHFQGESAKMFGSTTLLSGIVRNLCENALKYNKVNGSVSVSVKSNQDFVTLVVEDTGIGISEKDQSLIFQRFFRVDKSRSKEIGGTGLGLSIVKHSVAVHQGVLSMESAVDVGTMIKIEFPKTLQKTNS